MTSKPGQHRRERLPDRRGAETVELVYGDNAYTVTTGLYRDGRPGEVFLSGAKAGSDVDGLLADIGVVLSRLLQFGDRLEDIARGMARLGDGITPASIIGAALDRLTEDEPAASVNDGESR